MKEFEILILHITRRQLKPGVAVLEMEGSIHAGPDCRRVEEEVETLIRGNEIRVIFDLSGLTHIDSAAIGTMVRCFSKLKKCNGGLRLAGVKGMLEGTLKLTHVDKVFEIYPTALEAAEDFFPPSGSSSSENH